MQGMKDNRYDNYFRLLERMFTEIYSIALDARIKGLDPELEPESKGTQDLAERVEKSVGPIGVAERIRDLSQAIPREEIAFKIAEEIVNGRFQLEEREIADQAVRTALAILGEGVTVAPLQGIVKIDEKRNFDGTRHLSIYFAGPIRSAGGTEMALTLIITDFVRQLLGLDRYKATEEEANRFVEELRIYEREVARFQYKFSNEIIYDVVLNLPVEVTGVETNHIEVTNYKNLQRIETNRVRGGALRVLNDGLLGRANKVLKIIEKLGISGWEWLKEIKSGVSDSKSARELMFMEDVIAGRPIFSFPSREGGFRLRYGRARNTGLASYGLNPYTMEILGGFIATGTQLRIEKPGKAGIVAPVDILEPPIVKLKDGSVARADQIPTNDIKNSIEKILFLGDILVGFGEFVENNKYLETPGYVEEWWIEELKNKLTEHRLHTGDNDQKFDQARLNYLIKNTFTNRPTIDEAFKLSQMFDLPLYPSYTYFWELLQPHELMLLREKIVEATSKKQDNKKGVNKLRIKNDDNIKNILEKLCVTHRVKDNYILFEEPESLILRRTLNPLKSYRIKKNAHYSSLEILKNVSGFTIKAKGGTFIGARMGRPEKAKLREMKPLIHSLFPIGLIGGSRRNIMEAVNKENVSLDVINRFCSKCQIEAFSIICPTCGEKTVIQYICSICNLKFEKEGLCPKCKGRLVGHSKRAINIKTIIDKASQQLGLIKYPDLVKGVKGLTNDLKIPEIVEKGLLRSIFGLSVFKDGTIRFDSTNAVLTFFKPTEISLSIDKALQLGYINDYKGKPLQDSQQLCALKLQDIIVPKDCGEYFLKVAQFIDELLVKVYKLPAFYKVKDKKDLIGHLVVGLSPHTSVGVIGRLIGYSDTNVCFAHPLWHAAKRRDCDGDEDSVSLALDMLLNFSKQFLPSKIGGLMDAPLLMTVKILPTEVARQAFNIEAVWQFPLTFYKAAEEHLDSKKISEDIEMIFHRLCTSRQFDQIPFTHLSTNINKGVHRSTYSTLPTMLDKVTEQLELANKISAVDVQEVAKKVVSTHFMRDLVGNLKAYSSQKVRCKKCNMKYRRIPLVGKCLNCGGELLLTVYKGSIEKYLKIAKNIVQKYDIGEYHEQRLMLISNDIDSLFKEEPSSIEDQNNKHLQRDLSDFM
jgi:DNA polymerase II large subunit